ncbi:hypothetical protein FLA_0749 [Filimonas lacunae]|nr:hypothetical protein FLA_0749 [Filimonas lacunae]
MVKSPGLVNSWKKCILILIMYPYFIYNQKTLFHEKVFCNDIANVIFCAEV